MVKETKLQLMMSDWWVKGGYLVINGNIMKSTTLGKTIEMDQIILPPHPTRVTPRLIIEYWHSKDREYRARKDGVLRSKRYKKDIAKTKLYLSLGCGIAWVDQAYFRFDSKRRVEELKGLFLEQMSLDYTKYSNILPQFRRFDEFELEEKPIGYEETRRG